jgi:hypothetical protein
MTLQVSDINSTVTLNCNVSSANENVTWIKSSDIVHTIASDSKINITNNGKKLTISNLAFMDSFTSFGCLINGSRFLVNSFYLIVRSKKIFI